MMRVKVYGTSYCGYCRRAEELLKREGVPFDYVDVTHDPRAREWLVERADGRRTVPVIFFGDDVIGGYQELAAVRATGQLNSRLLAAAAAQAAAHNDNANVIQPPIPKPHAA